MIEALSKLDNLVKGGKILEAFDTYFADNVITSDEVGNITSSKEEKRGLLEGFFRDFKNHEEITLFDSFVNDDTSYSHFRFVFKKESGEKFKWDEVIIRKWKDKLVISEFYSNQDYTELKKALVKPVTKKTSTKSAAKTAVVKKEVTSGAAKTPTTKTPAKKAVATKSAVTKKTK